jgi:hypothetical protein
MIAPYSHHPCEVFEVSIRVVAAFLDRFDLCTQIARSPTTSAIGIGVGPALPIVILKDGEYLVSQIISEANDDDLSVP